MGKPVISLWSKGVWFWRAWLVGCDDCHMVWGFREYGEAKAAFDAHYLVVHPI